jgi:hypothetical protein
MGVFLTALSLLMKITYVNARGRGRPLRSESKGPSIRIMLGPSGVTEPLFAEKQRSSLSGLKKYEMKITCPLLRSSQMMPGSGNNFCESWREKLPLSPALTV